MSDLKRIELTVKTLLTLIRSMARFDVKTVKGKPFILKKCACWIT